MCRRNRRKLWVGANRPDHHDLRDAGQARLLDNVQAHQHVVVKIGSRILLVRPNPPYARCQVEYDLGPNLIVEATNPSAIQQIAVGGARHGDVFAPSSGQPLDEMRAKKPCASGHDGAPCVCVHVGSRDSGRLLGLPSHAPGWNSSGEDGSSLLTRLSIFSGGRLGIKVHELQRGLGALQPSIDLRHAIGLDSPTKVADHPCTAAGRRTARRASRRPRSTSQ